MRIPSHPSPIYYNSASSVDIDSRKRPPRERDSTRDKEDDQEDYYLPPRKQPKKGKERTNSSHYSQESHPVDPKSVNYGKRNGEKFRDREGTSGRNGYVSGSGSPRNSRVSHHREEKTDLREFLSDSRARSSDRRYNTHHGHHYHDHHDHHGPHDDFPRTPLMPPDRRNSSPAIPPNRRNSNGYDEFRQPLLLNPSARLSPLLPLAHERGPLLPPPNHLPNRRYSDVIDRRPEFRTRSDYYEPSYGHRRHRTQGDGDYFNERGFRGSKHTAHMLDMHDRRHGSHSRF